MKFGELVGRAVRDATLEALRWQNGLEAELHARLFHALGRYGVREATIFDDLAPLLEPADLELLRRNSKAAFYEPLVGAAAHALATVLDRVRHGTLPPRSPATRSCSRRRAWRSSLAAQPDRWPEFRARLHAARRCRSAAAGARRDCRSAGARSGARAERRAARRIRSRSSSPSPPIWRWAIPSIALHPVRLIGGALTVIEAACARSAPTDTAAASRCSCCCRALALAASRGLVAAASRRVDPARPGLLHVFLLYSLLALGDLLRHVWRVERGRPRRPRSRARGHCAARRSRHRSHGRRGLPARGGREPEREPDRWLHQRGVLVRGRRPARARAVQGGEHDGLDGRLQDRALSALRLVRRPPGRCR